MKSRKYTIYLIQVKIYEKDLVFFCEKDNKMYEKSFPKASKGALQ